MRSFIQIMAKMFFVITAFIHFSVAAITLNGTTDIHDPSTIVKNGNIYWTFGSGGGAVIFQSIHFIPPT